VYLRLSYHLQLRKGSQIHLVGLFAQKSYQKNTPAQWKCYEKTQRAKAVSAFWQSSFS
jgi:hypothetical protein